MIGFLPLIGLFANIVMQALGANGVVSAATSTTVTGLITGVTGLLAGLTSGATKTADILAVLAGLSSIIATLKADTALPADKLAEINALDTEIQAAIAAYVVAGQGYNPANYSLVATV